MRRQLNAKPVADPVTWRAIDGSLDEQGYAVTPQLLTRGECGEIAALYPREEVFRSRVIMQRHAYGRGEYEYFKYPLPSVIEGLAWPRRRLMVSTSTPLAISALA